MTIYTQEKTNNCISSSKAHCFKLFNKSYSFGFFSKMNWISRRRRSGKKLFSLLTCCSSSSSSDINTYEKNRNTDSRQDSSNRLSNNNIAAPSQTLTYSTTSEISKEKEKVNNDIESFINDIKNNDMNNHHPIEDNSNNNNEHPHSLIKHDPETNSITSSISKKSNPLYQHPIEQSESVDDLHETTTPSLESEQDLWLLGPINENLKGRKCLVLDMDETLLHSSFKVAPGADFVVPVEIDGTHHNVFVLKRPGVDAFMKRMGELYEIVVFTASLSKVKKKINK
ncbi:unnamed protein product [Cunninghamella blakesleeana]